MRENEKKEKEKKESERGRKVMKKGMNKRVSSIKLLFVPFLNDLRKLDGSKSTWKEKEVQKERRKKKN